MLSKHQISQYSIWHLKVFFFLSPDIHCEMPVWKAGFVFQLLYNLDTFAYLECNNMELSKVTLGLILAKKFHLFYFFKLEEKSKWQDSPWSDKSYFSSALAGFKSPQEEFSKKVIYNLLNMETFHCFQPAACGNNQGKKKPTTFPWFLITETTSARYRNSERRMGIKVFFII